MLYERMAIMHTKMKETFPHFGLLFHSLTQEERGQKKGGSGENKVETKPPLEALIKQDMRKDTEKDRLTMIQVMLICLEKDTRSHSLMQEEEGEKKGGSGEKIVETKVLGRTLGSLKGRGHSGGWVAVQLLLKVAAQLLHKEKRVGGDGKQVANVDP